MNTGGSHRPAWPFLEPTWSFQTSMVMNPVQQLYAGRRSFKSKPDRKRTASRATVTFAMATLSFLIFLLCVALFHDLLKSHGPSDCLGRPPFLESCPTPNNRLRQKKMQPKKCSHLLRGLPRGPLGSVSNFERRSLYSLKISS